MNPFSRCVPASGAIRHGQRKGRFRHRLAPFKGEIGAARRQAASVPFGHIAMQTDEFSIQGDRRSLPGQNGSRTVIRTNGGRPRSWSGTRKAYSSLRKSHSCVLPPSTGKPAESIAFWRTHTAQGMGQGDHRNRSHWKFRQYIFRAREWCPTSRHLLMMMEKNRRLHPLTAGLIGARQARRG